MVEKEDLRLSLSLSMSNHVGSCNNNRSNWNHSSLRLNLVSSMPSPAPASQFTPFQKTSGNDSLPYCDRNSESYRAGETRSFLRGIDVNRPPANADEEEAGVSSPNSTISSVSGKRSEKENNCDDHENERGSSRGASDEEDGDTSRKKLRLSKDQSVILEDIFKEHNTLNPKQKLALAKRLGLRARQVEVWFQNRRARTKLKQTEVDCDFLKRCCEQLTEENKRLQKEVQDLRALKLSPQFYMQMTPPTTLTMCPSCERVTLPPPSSAAQPSDPPPNPVAAAHPQPLWVGARVPFPPFENPSSSTVNF